MTHSGHAALSDRGKRPFLCIVDTGRKGETRQCEALAHACGVPWAFVGPESVPAVEPTAILSFGRALKAACRIKDVFGGRPAIVQLGRPRLMAPHRLDLIILMPQDDFPSGPNVVRLSLPLNGADMTEGIVFPREPREDGVVSVLLGGPTRHFFFEDNDISILLNRAHRLAMANGERLHVVPGPRTPQNIQGYLERRYEKTPDVIQRCPLSDILARSSRLVVTADSASLVADAWRSGCPTWLYPLKPRLPPVQRLKMMADRLSPEVRHSLIRRGWLAGGTDFLRWYRTIVHRGWIRPLTKQGLSRPTWRMTHAVHDRDLAVCRDRVLRILAE
ncbi:nucleoside-diphosphate sugar epimerase [Acetobacter estunensis]|uniref:Nucleoside-diphosphate sugar epimerase n=1 Tax=Acetobacter estunensis TaxID=104097 RepID=A0A967B807_9PROT|nr:ELM1/GtrOC1 family putative glycosyltransferase [Acetobacter estunensis]NHO54064.1 nucleoside-diphosphate sugar epimerase [Acetobacter estunensis]